MGRVVLVTGCSRGIGHQAALRLAERGWTVVGTVRGETGREALRRAGVEVAWLDVADEDRVAEVVEETVHRHGRLDALVANAGFGLFGCFEDLAPSQVRALFEVNVFGAMACARAALPHLRRSRGRLVAISSVAGRRAAPGSSAYSATKFALEGWAEALRHELRPAGVGVVLVEPGPTATGFAEARVRGAGAGRGPYAPVTRRLEEVLARSERRSASPEPLIRAIVRALEAPDPPLRLPVGASARLQILAARLLPWRVYEALVQAALRLPAPEAAGAAPVGTAPGRPAGISPRSP